MEDSVPLLYQGRSRIRLSLSLIILQTVCVLLFTLISPSSASAQHCAIEAGSPSCGVNQDIGSNRQDWTPGHHVGNPIDVISGNKYQVELDYQALGSALSFKRHYNTALVEHDNRLGHGWRHSYHVVLSRISNDQYQIVQSDGRRILFSRSLGASASDSDSDVNIFKPRQSADGELQQSDLFVWRLPDGRQFTFHGSFLIRIDFDDETKNHLELFYEQRKLRTITDQFNRKLTLEYTGGDMGLDRYDTHRAQPMPGHLERLILPNGQSIQYGYDSTKNLTRVQYPENSSHAYEYSDNQWTHHLTKRSYLAEDALLTTDTRSWAYDFHGRANQYRSNNSKTNLDIVYRDESSNADSGTVHVHYEDTGAVISYAWQLNRSGTDRLVTAITERPCADCDEKTFIPPRSDESSPLVDPPFTIDQSAQPDDQNDRPNPSVRSIQQPRLIQSSGSTDTFLLPSGEQLRLSTDRTGNIINIANDQLDLRSALDNIARGNTQCTGTTKEDCKKQLETLIMQADEIRRASQLTGGVSARSVNNGPGCSLPPGRSCSELERDYEMAVLSQCVYHSGPCNSVWQVVNPTSIGMTQTEFEEGEGFFARLYQHPSSNEYVLAFRGSLEFTDWVEDLSQMNGRATPQYLRAEKLSKSLSLYIPMLNISYTGHSLGGGLATVAALANSRQATIFNSAALHPETARKLSIPYNNANLYVDNLTVDGEIVTLVQDYPPTSPSIFDSTDQRESHPERIYYPAPGNRFVLPATSNNLGSIDRHKTDAVVNSVRMILQNACGVFP